MHIIINILFHNCLENNVSIDGNKDLRQPVCVSIFYDIPLNLILCHNTSSPEVYCLILGSTEIYDELFISEVPITTINNSLVFITKKN